jgi:hypothetical protein
MYGKVLVDEACRASDQNLVKILFSNLRIQLGMQEIYPDRKSYQIINAGKYGDITAFNPTQFNCGQGLL